MSADISIAAARELLDQLVAINARIARLHHHNDVDDDAVAAAAADDDMPLAPRSRRTSTAAASGESKTRALRRRAELARDRRQRNNDALASEMSRDIKPLDLDIAPRIGNYQPITIHTTSLPMPVGFMGGNGIDGECLDVTGALDRTGEMPSHGIAAQQQMRVARETAVHAATTPDDYNALITAQRSLCKQIDTHLTEAQALRGVERRHWLGLKHTTASK